MDVFFQKNISASCSDGQGNYNKKEKGCLLIKTLHSGKRSRSIALLLFSVSLCACEDKTATSNVRNLVMNLPDFESTIGYCARKEDGPCQFDAQFLDSGSFSLKDSGDGYEYDYTEASGVVYVTGSSEQSATDEFMSDVAFTSLDSFARAVISKITDGGLIYSSNDMLPFAKKCFAAANSFSFSAIVGGQEWYTASVELETITGDSDFASSLKGLLGDNGYNTIIAGKSWYLSLLLASDLSKAYPSMAFGYDGDDAFSL